MIVLKFTAISGKVFLCFFPKKKRAPKRRGPQTGLAKRTVWGEERPTKPEANREAGCVR